MDEKGGTILAGKEKGARTHFAARGGDLVHLVCLVYLVRLVYLICLVRRTRETRQQSRSMHAKGMDWADPKK
jgi:hypothetical protein